MTIAIDQMRIKPSIHGKETHDLGRRIVSVHEALLSLVKYELGFGGHPTKVTDKSITIKTEILHNEDITIFTGEKEEMEILFFALKCWIESTKNDEIYIDKIAEQLEGQTTLVLSQFGSILIGMHRVKGILLAALQVSEDHIKEFLDKPDADVLSAIELYAQGDVGSLDEALALI